MILDKLENAIAYEQIHRSFVTAFSFLKSTDLETFPPGRIEIDGNSIYALVQEYMTKPLDQGIWEAHRRYIDVQYLVSGVERCGLANLGTMNLGDYVPERDFQPMSGVGQMIELSAGSFMIFFPQDAHMPGLMTNLSTLVKKIVIKCLI